jgi:hypothetical protein
LTISSKIDCKTLSPVPWKRGIGLFYKTYKEKIKMRVFPSKERCAEEGGWTK